MKIAVACLVLSAFVPSAVHAAEKSPRVIYPKKTELYFQRRPEEKFDSLVKPRKNFHPEMVRDILQTR